MEIPEDLLQWYSHLTPVDQRAALSWLVRNRPSTAHEAKRAVESLVQKTCVIYLNRRDSLWCASHSSHAQPGAAVCNAMIAYRDATQAMGSAIRRHGDNIKRCTLRAAYYLYELPTALQTPENGLLGRYCIDHLNWAIGEYTESTQYGQFGVTALSPDGIEHQCDHGVQNEDKRTCIKCGYTGPESSWPPCPNCRFDSREPGKHRTPVLSADEAAAAANDRIFGRSEPEEEWWEK